MTENIPDNDNVGSPTGRIDSLGWRKIGKGAGLATVGCGLGSFTGGQLLQVAIEQGWIAQAMPAEQPATFGLLMAGVNILFCVLTLIAHKWLANYPAVEQALQNAQNQ